LRPYTKDELLERNISLSWPPIGVENSRCGKSLEESGWRQVANEMLIEVNKRLPSGDGGRGCWHQRVPQRGGAWLGCWHSWHSWQSECRSAEYSHPVAGTVCAPV